MSSDILSFKIKMSLQLFLEYFSAFSLFLDREFSSKFVAYLRLHIYNDSVCWKGDERYQVFFSKHIFSHVRYRITLVTFITPEKMTDHVSGDRSDQTYLVSVSSHSSGKKTQTVEPQFSLSLDVALMCQCGGYVKSQSLIGYYH